jgi:hypothetical protein
VDVTRHDVMTTRNGFHDLMIIQTRQAEIADEFSVKALDESPFPGVIMTKGIVMDWLRASLIAQIVPGVVVSDFDVGSVPQ